MKNGDGRGEMKMKIAMENSEGRGIMKTKNEKSAWISVFAQQSRNFISVIRNKISNKFLLHCILDNRCPGSGIILFSKEKKMDNETK